MRNRRSYESSGSSKGVYLEGNLVRSTPHSAQVRDFSIADLETPKFAFDAVLTKLRITTRLRNGSNIDDFLDRPLSQHLHEVLD